MIATDKQVRPMDERREQSQPAPAEVRWDGGSGNAPAGTQWDGGSQSAPSKAQWKSYAGLAVALALIVGAIWLVEGGKVGEADATSTSITLAGTLGGVAPKVGEPAPEFSLQTADGNTLSLAELRGKAVVINFWASWCPPCRGEMPDLDSLARQHQDAGLVVVAVNLQEDAPTVRRYAQTLGLTLPIVLDSAGAVATRYNLTSLPTTYFVDRQGVVRDLNVGALTAKGLSNKVAKVLE